MGLFQLLTGLELNY